ncbi:hypothetical protein D3C86_2045370 [compost metagenome]
MKQKVANMPAAVDFGCLKQLFGQLHKELPQQEGAEGRRQKRYGQALIGIQPIQAAHR